MMCGQIAESELAVLSWKKATHSFSTWRLATGAGWLLTTAALGSIIGNFISAINNSRAEGKDIPWWVYMVIVPQILFFACFGIVALWHAFDPSRPYVQIEEWYIWLSFSAKAFLGIWALAGLSQQKHDS